jgi:hypothetical protein
VDELPDVQGDEKEKLKKLRKGRAKISLKMEEIYPRKKNKA